ncbi:hypothetical protein TGAM01_v208439 [Trichoderma gamsii]|uniref:Protein kinase domain-containing protein n=1 Tax=Trichoderma gamsii TaxID=398673 RepID=A0A2P4ZEN5_9HYPO|nr:hypothetical protein TGAM01_v208439 [Trichoderma gamsii]PON22752.1 hypothetical protein TGAM01_v208439 [Trichoderma gamsii]
MSGNISDGPALPNANGTAQAHADGSQEAQRALPGAMQSEFRSRRNNDNYTPTPQNLKNFLVTCHTLNQATVVFLDTPPQQQDTSTPDLQEKDDARKIVKSPDFMGKQKEVWQILLESEESSFHQTVFPSADQVHDKFFVIERVDGETKLCPFDRLGVSATVLALVRQVLGDPALSQAAGIRGNILYSSAGGSTQLGIPAEPQFHDNAFEDGQYRGLSLFFNINNNRPLCLVTIEYRPKHFALDSSMIAALESGIVLNRGINGDDSSPTGIITSLITQLLDFMVQSGVRYGYLYSVEGIVFLEIQNDPSVVHYFVSLPKEEVDHHVESTMPYSAVSQIFAFVIRAMRTSLSSMHYLNQPNELAPWSNQADESAIRNKQADERAAWNYKVDEHVAWGGPVVAQENNIEEIAMQLQQWGKTKVSSAQCEEGQDMAMDTDADSSANEFDGEPYDKCEVDIGEETSVRIEIKMDSDITAVSTPSGQMQCLTLQREQSVQNDETANKETQMKNRQEIAQASDDHDDEMHDDGLYMNDFQKIISRPVKLRKAKEVENSYCTQQCLLGVAHSTPLDKACPNVHLHGNKHISKKEFLERLKDQLSQSGESNDYCTPLEQFGAIGKMFKVALVGHGYTFVAKATLRADWVFLHREGEMYELLKDLQGSVIPVCLGIVRVDPEFYHEDRLLSQFMVLSWAGLPFQGNFDEGVESLLTDTVIGAYRQLHMAGMQHRDPDLSNMLYNPLTSQVMLVDFHGSRLHPDRVAAIEAAEKEAKEARKNDPDYESEDEGIPYEADGSLRTTPKPPPTAEELEALRRKFEEECRQELEYAVESMKWFVSGQHDRRN